MTLSKMFIPKISSLSKIIFSVKCACNGGQPHLGHLADGSSIQGKPLSLRGFLAPALEQNVPKVALEKKSSWVQAPPIS